MTDEMKIYKILLGILIAALALYLGQTFWVWFMFSFGSVIGVWFTAVMLGYIYMVIGLVRLKKWAWFMFLIILILAIFAEILFVLIGDAKGSLIEGFYHSIFWVSLVAIPVFGISALIRKRIKGKNNK